MAKKSGGRGKGRAADSEKASQQSSAKGKTVLQAAASSDRRARTIIYVHGIANKPPQEILKCQWDHALFGFDLGEKSRVAYWVNRERYPVPYPGTCGSGDLTSITTNPTAMHIAGRPEFDEMLASEERLFIDQVTPDEEQVLRGIRNKMRASVEEYAGDEALNILSMESRSGNYQAKILPFRSIREWFTSRLTALFLADVHDYFYDEDRREVMRESLRSRLLSGGGPFIVIGHSQGSMIAYDVLSSLKKNANTPEVELFLTLGSPLGIQEVQDQIQKLTGQKTLQIPAVVKKWVNVADPLDPVAADKDLAGEFVSPNGVELVDKLRWNLDSPQDPHSATGYLRMEDVRTEVLAAVDPERFQRTPSFTIARDLASNLESKSQWDRHPVLIELTDPTRGKLRRYGAELQKASEVQSRQSIREAVVEKIRKLAQKTNEKITDDDLDLEDQLDGFVSARLTRSEVEHLSAEFGKQKIHRMYKNLTKRTLLLTSIDTIQARTAHLGYSATGKGICWAVLDSGIDARHPHFETRKSIESVFDCMKRGALVEVGVPDAVPGKPGGDGNGHGTHVAGIIAGEMTIGSTTVYGIAPEAQLRIYKTLGDDGSGEDAKIIKALENIFMTNEQASKLVIHGVNLSLGGPFDPDAYGCGDTPLCRLLRKLWRQGVVVVLAAGNEGYQEIANGGHPLTLNVGISISDPANLDEAVSVGSIHKSRPHSNGVSYFSSRGPTADGRIKPDLVAPGERILSCRKSEVFPKNDSNAALKDFYVEMSGTSMAAPHVSGLLAAFLSARPEFIGFPDRVKALLLDNCTDLNRERFSQGAGMPNLVKMLLNS